MNKKIIFADIDGTLFDHETGKIPASALISGITDVESQRNSRLRYFSHFLQPKNPGPALALLFQNRSLRHTVETSRLRALPVRELFPFFSGMIKNYSDQETTQQTAYMRYVIHAFTCKSEIQ